MGTTLIYAGSAAGARVVAGDRVTVVWQSGLRGWLTLTDQYGAGKVAPGSELGGLLLGADVGTVREYGHSRFEIVAIERSDRGRMGGVE